MINPSYWSPIPKMEDMFRQLRVGFIQVEKMAPKSTFSYYMYDHKPKCSYNFYDLALGIHYYKDGLRFFYIKSCVSYPQEKSHFSNNCHQKLPNSFLVQSALVQRYDGKGITTQNGWEALYNSSNGIATKSSQVQIQTKSGHYNSLPQILSHTNFSIAYNLWSKVVQRNSLSNKSRKEPLQELPIEIQKLH